MELFWDIFKWWLFIAIGLFVSMYVTCKKENKPITKRDLKQYALFLAFMLILFSVFYISRLNDKLKTQETLKYYVKECLDKNRHLTYKQCENSVIDYLNDAEPYYDVDTTPQYR